MPRLAIRCKNLEKRYAPDVLAVAGLDLEVFEGECFGLLGPNGAGKTTTIEILEGLLEPTSGEVEVLGRRWGRRDRELRQKIGISLQETRLSEKLTVLETVTLFRSFYENGLDPDEAIEMLGLSEKARTWVGKLSGGQRQRLAVACALVGDPELFFLDEPTTGLDPQSRRQLWDLLKRLRAGGRTILITTHYMDEAERLCDRVAIVDHGRVIALGSPSELIASLGGEHVIEFAVENGIESAAAPGGEASTPQDLLNLLGDLPGVREARLNGQGASLTAGEPHVTLPVLLERLRLEGRRLTRLSTRHASLEDVFVKLTGRHLAEDNA
jgi:ABC-2 type transport system ATP-binding protein